MEHIVFEEVKGGDIEQCRLLCNELMAFQKSKAVMEPEIFDLMNFDTRMKKSYESAMDSQVIIVKDNGVPVGYVFSTVELIESGNIALPSWAPGDGTGFYPDWVTFPQKIGCLSNLYVRDTHRALGLGSKLFDLSMEWLESYPDVEHVFIYISNGNEAALNFYLSRGFTFSHDVFGGFIKAVYRSNANNG